MWIKTHTGYVNVEQIESFVINGLSEVQAKCANKSYLIKKFACKMEAEEYLEKLMRQIREAEKYTIK